MTDTTTASFHYFFTWKRWPESTYLDIAHIKAESLEKAMDIFRDEVVSFDDGGDVHDYYSGSYITADDLVDEKTSDISVFAAIPSATVFKEGLKLHLELSQADRQARLEEARDHRDYKYYLTLKARFDP